MTGPHSLPDDEPRLDREEVQRQLRELLAHGGHGATFRKSNLPNAVLRAQIAVLKGLRPDEIAEHHEKPSKLARKVAAVVTCGAVTTVVLVWMADKGYPFGLLQPAVTELAIPFAHGVADGIHD